MRIMPAVMVGIVLLSAAFGQQVEVKDPDGIGRFLGDEVVILMRIDLEKVNPVRDFPELLGPFSTGKEVEAATASAGEVVKQLQEGGAKVIHVLGDPTTLPQAPLCVVTLRPNADVRAIERTLGPIFPRGGPDFVEVFYEKQGDFLLAGSPQAVQGAREAGKKTRPDLLQALAEGGDAPIQIVMAMSDVQRRVIEETAGEFPRELGGGPLTPITRGMKWMRLGMRFQPKTELRMVVEAQDEESAAALRTLWRRFRDMLVKSVEGVTQSESAPAPGGQDAKTLAAIKEFAVADMELRGSRLEMPEGLSVMRAVLAPAVMSAREAARRAQCVNNLKQIGLAMHVYHDTYKRFPGAFTKTKDGKPGLSWRVHLLPYLEQESLYKQFHLDEAWDSPHNRELIKQMPVTYVCPSGRESREAGKTLYVAPRGPKTVLSGPEGAAINTITDGTSNTVMVMEVGDDEAVVWTKPDDWEVKEQGDLKLPTGPHPAGFNVMMCDGAVRFLKATIDSKIFRGLLTKNGGEAISGIEY